MQLNIEHRTVYSYSLPLLHSVQRLYLTPRSDARQTVHSWQMQLPGPCEGQSDSFGNTAHVMVMDGPLSEIILLVRGKVETSDAPGLFVKHSERVPTTYFLRPTLLTQPSPALQEFAEGFRPSMRRDPVATTYNLMLAVTRHVVFQPGSSTVATTAAAAFDAGYGVCQDHAHVFIAVCRSLGLPARYVSGYLFSHSLMDEHIATHAWVEVWIERYGWLSLDITNRKPANGGHVRLAVGLDYQDVCPVRGVRRGGGIESMVASVRVSSDKPLLVGDELSLAA